MTTCLVSNATTPLGLSFSTTHWRWGSLFRQTPAIMPAPTSVDIKVQPIASRKSGTSSSLAATGKTPSYKKSTTDGPTEAQARLKYTPGKWDIWMLGITIVIGGQYFCWNAGLSAGLYSYMICVFLVATAYVTLCCCMSEISGALPFAGGAYGLARCTLGFYPAFIIGCCEALEYIAYVSTSVISLTDMIVMTSPGAASVRPLIWAAFYISALFFHIKGDRTFWYFNLAIGFVSIAIVFVFACGSLSYVDFGANAVVPDMGFVGGFAGFMKALPLASWFFVGVEALNLSSDQVASPKQNVPFAQIACVSTLVGTCTLVFFITVSLPPGLASLPSELVPLNNGFEPMFNISHTSATILSLPATYATAFGFMWCYGKLIAAMATSRLLPVFLSRASQGSGTPYMAITCGSALSYLICMVVYAVPSVATYLFNICAMSAFMSYTGQCFGYISLKRHYRNIKSSYFHNPFGLYGAVYSMCVWLLCIASIAGFQGHGGIEIIIFSVVVVLLSVYYYVWARKRQTFSVAENRILLVAHVTKFNGRRKVAGRKGGPSNSGNKTTTHQQNNTRFTNADSTHQAPADTSAKPQAAPKNKHTTGATATTTATMTTAASKRTAKSSGM